MITNLDRWRYFLQDCKSPLNFIDMSFYSMIAATLQRRVWYGRLTDSMPQIYALFPNMYVILCGPPSVGKGLAIKPVKAMLNYHKRNPTKEQVDPLAYAEDGNEQLIDLLQKRAKSTANNNIIKLAPDSTSAASLILSMANAVDKITYRFISKDGEAKLGTYFHNSLTFALEEISSLFRKNTEDIVNFLLSAFDCGDYRNSTIKRGEEFIPNCCLNILGGTTPKFMKATFDDQLLNEGFASRTIYVYANTPRFVRFGPIEHDHDQLVAQAEILRHMLELTKIYGPINYTPDAFSFMKDYFTSTHQRVNINPKLDDYYGRKDIHAPKLAAAIHFADSLTMQIELHECQRAIAMLDHLEEQMHRALVVGGRNPLAGVADRVLTYIERKGQVHLPELILEFMSDATQQELEGILRTLQIAGKLKFENRTWKVINASL